MPAPVYKPIRAVFMQSRPAGEAGKEPSRLRKESVP